MYLWIGGGRIFNVEPASRFQTAILQIIDLRSRSELLKGVSFIVGERLYSNIYVVGKKQVTVVDTGVFVL